MSPRNLNSAPARATRVLAVTIGGMGDAVLFSPVLRALRSRYPAARVDLLVASPLAAEMYMGAESLSRVMTVHTHVKGLLGKAAALVPFAAGARMSGGYDLGVYATGLNAGWAGFLAVAAGIRATMRAPTVPERDTDLACNVALARCFDAGVTEQDAFMPIEEDDRAEARDGLAQAGLSLARDCLVAVYPSIERWHRPRWPMARLVAVAARLKTTDRARKIVVVGGPGEGEDWRAADKDGVADAHLAGRLSVRAVAALFEKCRLALCNDGGLMHVAGALDCPVVAVLPTAPSSYHPPGTRSAVVHSTLECRRCWPNRPRWCKNPECVQAVSAEQVYEACLAVWPDKSG